MSVHALACTVPLLWPVALSLMMDESCTSPWGSRRLRNLVPPRIRRPSQAGPGTRTQARVRAGPAHARRRNNRCPYPSASISRPIWPTKSLTDPFGRSLTSPPGPGPPPISGRSSIGGDPGGPAASCAHPAGCTARAGERPRSERRTRARRLRAPRAGGAVCLLAPDARTAAAPAACEEVKGRGRTCSAITVKLSLSRIPCVRHGSHDPLEENNFSISNPSFTKKRFKSFQQDVHS